ncbi:MAG: hypothetical protein ACLFNB_01275 [Candidatus Woesearchaeota archaeon]
MNLTSEKKKILTLLDEIPVKHSCKWIQELIDISEKKLKQLISTFLAEGLIEISDISCEGEETFNWFFHSSKVTSDMQDDELRYNVDFGNVDNLRYDD